LTSLEVEHAFSAHMKGTFAKPPQFNLDNCAKLLKDFFINIDKVKEDRWSTILQFSGANENKNSDADGDVLQADQSMISAFRIGMYVSSSPAKP
ncbi:hypothetical protein L208DRAFT_1257724, partial [Tricholoma matsutake]